MPPRPGDFIRAVRTRVLDGSPDRFSRVFADVAFDKLRRAQVPEAEELARRR